MSSDEHTAIVTVRHSSAVSLHVSTIAMSSRLCIFGNAQLTLLNLPDAMALQRFAVP